jgi:hypothetical protein
MATEVQVKDVAGVRSRVSWGAILGGTMAAVAVFFLLSVLGTAIGATVLYRSGDTDISLGAAIWAVITMVLALFSGGCVASQCTAGETKEESVMYGVIMWGTIFTMLVALMATRINIGFVDVMRVTVGSTQTSPTLASTATEKQLRDQNFTAEQIAWLKSNHPGFVQAGNVQTVQDIAQDQRTVTAAWWTFGGILLSMLAAISGALTGAGPTFRLVNLGWHSVLATHHHQPGAPRTAV